MTDLQKGEVFFCVHDKCQSPYPPRGVHRSERSVVNCSKCINIIAVLHVIIWLIIFRDLVGCSRSCGKDTYENERKLLLSNLS